MRRFACCLVAAAVVCALPGTHVVLAEDEQDLPLPRWTPQELDAMRGSPGRSMKLGDLLGEIGDLAVPPASRPLLLGESEEIVGDSPEKSQPSADLSRFLPLSLLTSPRSHPQQQSSPSPVISIKDVPEEFILDCIRRPALTRLIDPNQELSETAVEDFERFLAFHANDSHIPLCLVILGRSQKLPDGAELAGFAHGSVSQGSSALLVLPYGEPWRTRLFVSQPIRDGVPASYLNSLLESSIKDALQATDPDEQLHRLLVQMSIRLFWVQRMLVATKAAPLAIRSPSAERHVSTLQEVTPPTVQQPFRISGMSVERSLVVMFFMAVLFYAFRRWQRFKLRHYEWLLPAPAEAAPQRLGGPFCGGAASLRYR